MQLLTNAQRIINNVEVDEKYTVLDMIKIENLNDFTVRCLNVFSNEEKLLVANKVGDVVVQMLMKKNLISPNTQQSFVDVLLTATMFHNMFYDPSDWTTLFLARKNLMPIAIEMEVPIQVTDAIFQTIEAQLGDNTPIPALKPIANSPTEIFAWAIWIVKEFKPNV